MTEYRLRLDLQWFAGEKTEKATPKKKKEAREQGQVAKSAELPGALILFFAMMFLILFGGYFKERIFRLFTVSFNEYMLIDVSANNVLYIFGNLLRQGAFLLAPIMIIAVIIAYLGNYVQIGFLFTSKPLKPSFTKLNPLSGLKKMFAMRSLIELVKSLLKLIIVGFIAYTTIIGQKERLIVLAEVPLENLIGYVADITLSLGLKIAGLLIVLALLDFMYQKYEHAKKLRMSKQDIKDEFKKTEGDPLIKGKIREKQRRLAIQRMMQDIPNADVIITNPTHFAVAIQYDAEKMDSPKVIAKGQDYIALKIREVAKQHDIITMENKPLARALYERVEIGEFVPAELFQAVAEVLAYVYRINKKA